MFIRLLLLTTIGLLFLSSLCALTAQAAEPTPNINHLLEQAQLKNIAYDPYWLKLLHYPQATSPLTKKATSEIINPGFFLSATGKKNPEAELEATLRSFFIAPGTAPDSHAQCRFIARYQWLKKQLDWSLFPPPEVSCKQFDNWSLNGKIKSISLIFVTGYLSNPASFYGHILLKANPEESNIPADLLSQTINYGAIVPENENPLIYIANGIFGGYDATFSHAQFYRYNHNYGENELRDMWEYELALSPNEIEQLIAHAWELLDARFTYYFAKENCAYQMSALLELVTNEPLFNRDTPWLLPATIFDGITSIKKDGQSIIHRIKKTPSRQSRFHNGFSALDDNEKTILKLLVKDKKNLYTPTFMFLDDIKKTRIVDTLIDYYEFRLLTENHDRQYQHKKNIYLIERSKLPPQTIQTHTIAEKASPPHEGPLPSMIRIEALSNNMYGPGIQLQFRPAYYDMLIPDAGRIPNSKLTMFNIQATHLNNQTYIRSLDLVDIETLNLSKTGLPGDGGTAWRLKFGLNSEDLGCINCLMFNVDGGIGKAVALSEKSVIYGMIGGVVQNKRENSGTLAGSVSISLLSNLTPYWKTHLSIRQKQYINHTQKNHLTTHWENRLGISRHWDIRISYKKDVADEIGVATSLYW